MVKNPFNANEIAKIINELFEVYKINKDNLRYFNTEAPSVMTSVFTKLKQDYDFILVIHVRCISHIIDLVIKKILEIFPEVNSLLKLVKSLFGFGKSIQNKNKFENDNYLKSDKFNGMKRDGQKGLLR